MCASALLVAMGGAGLTAGAADPYRLLLDFGETSTTTEHAAAPDDPVLFWNNVTTATGNSSSATLPGLVTTTNVATAVGFSMVSRFNGGNGVGSTLSTVYANDATRDTLFGNTEDFGGLSNVSPSFKLTGLDPASRYSFTFYAARIGVADNRETTYTVTGATTATATLNASENVNGVVTVQLMTPTGAGEITISMAPGPGNDNANHFTYLGVLQVDATSAAIPGRLDNVSIRAKVRQGQDIMIAGFVVDGAGSKKLLIRGVGPTLGTFNVPDVLTDSYLELFRLDNPPVIVSENDDWGLAPNLTDLTAASTAVFAFALPTASKDAALLVDLPAGRYTANLRGTNGESGAALVELYDADSVNGGTATTRITNISLRGQVGSGADTMIAGFVVAGEANERLLVRVVGPELAQFNLQGVLTDPTLEVFQTVAGTSTSMATNDDWGVNETAVAAAAVQVQAFPLDSGSTSAALILDLAPGVYTVHASSKNGSLGLALVEVYELP